MTDYNKHMTEDARLVILKELAEQTDFRLNQTILLAVLDNFGHKRSAEWLRTQLRALEELGAVKLHRAGSIMIAELTRAGHDHVDRRTVIDGIARPKPTE